MPNTTLGLKSAAVIAAIPKAGALPEIPSCVNAVFLLSGDVLEMPRRIDELKRQGKTVFVHIDLIEGLGKDTKALDFIAQKIRPDGIISTRNNILKRAKEMRLFTVQRIFLLDSISFERGIQAVQSYHPDFVEVMPGIATRAIADLKGHVTQPIIAGGMIKSEKEIESALKAGAVAVSTSRQQLWQWADKKGESDNR